MASVWGELKRRKVIRVAIAYVIGSWLVLQFTGVLATLLEMPNWFGRLVILLVVICFPVAMVLAWVFDITPDGIVRDRTFAGRKHGLKMQFVLLGAVLISTGWVLYRVGIDLASEQENTDSIVRADKQEQPGTLDVLPNSIAVLPFENLSPDPDNAYFAAGLHEEILSQLAKIHDLSVISRTSVLRYADGNSSIPEIADELRVQTVMEGSVRFANENVRIQAQLIDGDADENLWVEVYQRDFQDVFAIQGDIAARVASALKIELLPQEKESIEKRTTESSIAFALYLKALSLKWDTSTQREEPLSLLSEAITTDPDFGLALALRARIRATSLNNDPGLVLGWTDRSAEIERLARSDVERALTLDPTLGNAHLALARIHQYHWRGREARKAYENGLQASPNDVEILLGFAWFNSVAGDHEYAISLATRAVELDPNNARAHAEMGQRQTFAGNWNAALAAHRTAAKLNPAYGVYRLRIANNEIALGNTVAAIDELRSAEILINSETASPDLLAELAYAYAQARSINDARRLVERLEELNEDRVVGVGTWAMARLALGEHEEALRLLQAARVEVVDKGVLDGGFKALAQIAANVLADPNLDQSEFAEIRSELKFRQ